MNTLPEHPGAIVYLDGDTGEVVGEMTIDQVPEALRFAPADDDTLVPVVKVVAHLLPGGRELLEYGPEGQLLRATMQRRTES